MRIDQRASVRLQPVTIQDGPTWAAFSWDGNLTSENRGGVRTTYSDDRENRLTVKNENGNRTTMTYHAEGLRMTRQTSSERTTLVWDGSDTWVRRAPDADSAFHVDGSIEVAGTHTMDGKEIDQALPLVTRGGDQIPLTAICNTGAGECQSGSEIRVRFGIRQPA